MALVKICGITNASDALHAVAAGADALGFVFVERSPRCVEPSLVAGIVTGLPPFVTTVGVFAARPVEEVEGIAWQCGLSLVQLHGDEGPEYCEGLGVRFIKAIRVRNEGSLRLLARYPQASAFLLDTYVEGKWGGTGQAFPWELALKAKAYGRIILSGGLTPENVVKAVRTVTPYAVDVSSGVEISPGRKDPQKVREFIERAKSLA